MQPAGVTDFVSGLGNPQPRFLDCWLYEDQCFMPHAPKLRSLAWYVLWCSTLIPLCGAVSFREREKRGSH